MKSTHSISKRIATLLAIALMLGSSLQHVHAFCLWSDATSEQAVADRHEEKSLSSTCCCHHHACTTQAETEPQQLPLNLPCDDNCQHCWCCQAPYEQIITSESNTSLKTSEILSLAANPSSLCLPDTGEQAASTISERASIAISAPARCAQLCRFLA